MNAAGSVLALGAHGGGLAGGLLRSFVHGFVWSAGWLAARSVGETWALIVSALLVLGAVVLFRGRVRRGG